MVIMSKDDDKMMRMLEEIQVAITAMTRSLQVLAYVIQEELYEEEPDEVLPAGELLARRELEFQGLKKGEN